LSLAGRRVGGSGTGNSLTAVVSLAGGSHGDRFPRPAPWGRAGGSALRRPAAGDISAGPRTYRYGYARYPRDVTRSHRPGTFHRVAGKRKNRKRHDGGFGPGTRPIRAPARARIDRGGRCGGCVETLEELK